MKKRFKLKPIIKFLNGMKLKKNNKQFRNSLCECGRCSARNGMAAPFHSTWTSNKFVLQKSDGDVGEVCGVSNHILRNEQFFIFFFLNFSCNSKSSMISSHQF